MIDLLFTIDYEIYGDGTGALAELVYQPTQTLARIFRAHAVPFIAFVEVAELEKIEAHGTDRSIDVVRKQVRNLHRNGMEIAFHLHPQWANAFFEAGRWHLDLSEYNLCKLPRKRIEEIVHRGLNYLRYVVDDPAFTPLSFRAGNWLFQPAQTAAEVLAEAGLRIDSSVFKGGRQRIHGLDYRAALDNGYFWRFNHDVNFADLHGAWVEVPIHTDMVRPWKMTTAKRIGYSNPYGVAARSRSGKLIRTLDFMRLRYPRKLDFTRMNLDELVTMTEGVIREDVSDPHTYRPVVAIGHTKDLTDFKTIETFLSFLRSKGIQVNTFAGACGRLFGRGVEPSDVQCVAVY